MTFDLAKDAWIPVRPRSAGAPTCVSLLDLFAQVREIADLAVMPHERVALLRLLVSLTQASVEPPPIPESWDANPTIDYMPVLDYLARADIAPQFQLVGEGPRFLQTQIALADENPTSVSKLFPRLASGNNPTLLDHAGGTNRVFAPADVALGLLTFQCFYPLYGSGYKGRGPCVEGNMAHSILQGDSLAETIRLNCLDAESIGQRYPVGGRGRPIWELTPEAPDFEDTATSSYLGRLVPRHRSLWLTDDGQEYRLVKEGFEYPGLDENFVEPSATVGVRSGKKGADDKKFLLPLKQERAIWRDLETLLVTRENEDYQVGAPMVISSHRLELERGDFSLWVGGLITDYKAKILDATESTLTIPNQMLDATGYTLYQAGVAYAEKVRQRLYTAVKTYGWGLEGKNRTERLPNKKELREVSWPTDKTMECFWHQLEGDKEVLFQVVRAPACLNGHFFGERKDVWTVAVWAAARQAYELTCPSQLYYRKAHIIGLGSLNELLRLPKEKKKSKPATAS